MGLTLRDSGNGGKTPRILLISPQTLRMEVKHQEFFSTLPIFITTIISLLIIIYYIFITTSMLLRTRPRRGAAARITFCARPPLCACVCVGKRVVISSQYLLVYSILVLIFEQPMSAADLVMVVGLQ